MEAAQYLRKSRLEEGMDTEEVLSRHRKALSEFAASRGIHIVETYYEVKSGESLYARPEMLRLLEDVEAGKFEAVLVMDLDRLSRGRMKDQGIILDTFRESGTLIITPDKSYDLADEIDDELAEFKTFMSRREYKIINKRLRRGLNQSIAEGWYVANAPYGYRKISVDRRPTLEIVPDEADIVRIMFDMYAGGHGCVAIANHVNALGARPHRSDAFSRNSVAKILRNPTYIGKVVWNQKSHIKKGSHGNEKHITIYNPPEQWLITEGRHPAIVEREVFERVQDIMKGRYVPGKNDGTIRSPLAGLVRCTNCGRNMQRMVMKGAPYLLCMTPGCCASARFEYVEEQLIQQLRDTLRELSVEKPTILRKNTAALEASLTAVRKELSTAAGQKDRLYELLEIGEYDLETFRTRMQKVKEKLATLEVKELEIQHELSDASTADPDSLRKKIQHVLSVYDASDAPHRNALLKSVLNTVWYTKAKKTKPRDFELRFDLKPF